MLYKDIYWHWHCFACMLLLYIMFLQLQFQAYICVYCQPLHSAYCQCCFKETTWRDRTVIELYAVIAYLCYSWWVRYDTAGQWSVVSGTLWLTDVGCLIAVVGSWFLAVDDELVACHSDCPISCQSRYYYYYYHLLWAELNAAGGANLHELQPVSGHCQCIMIIDGSRPCTLVDMWAAELRAKFKSVSMCVMWLIGLVSVTFNASALLLCALVWSAHDATPGPPYLLRGLPAVSRMYCCVAGRTSAARYLSGPIWAIMTACKDSSPEWLIMYRVNDAHSLAVLTL